ncbi:proline iminopeptidase-family hydrolase [Parachlamydia acanthamoebae]|uniref:proline iminopeptidase-family hydrolase n=1 Tax=Parachlamydia acanthamoebae TaxID=83552 RepID=UPI0009AEA8A9|nr:proline iminopeptidase-family hydrolase [Parachlamydia acanthamoebae]
MFNLLKISLSIFITLFFGSFAFAEETEEDLKAAKLNGAEFVHLDNGFKVWTKRVGNDRVKILTLHGGPGHTHEYLECMENYFSKDQFQIIFYDQLGSYHSDQPNDPSLWTIDRFCEEVEQIRKALNLNDFYLYGHSWGGLLAIEYSLKYQSHLKGVILAGITGSADSYVTHYNHLISNLPSSIKNSLKLYEEAGDTQNPAYEKLLFDEVYSKYLCRLKPWPDSLLRSFRHLNTQVYNVIQGPNEYIITGNSKDWSRWADLPKITIPTLLICGRYDAMDPNDLEKMGSLIPNSRTKVCENGSHCAFYDDSDVYFETIHNFLKDVEGCKRKLGD